MPNAFFTPTMIAKEFLLRLETELVLAKSVNKDFSAEFAMAGSSVKVRRPVYYLGQDNNLDLSAFTEDVTEGTTTVTLDQTWSDKVAISAIDRTLSFDRYSEMVIKPMALRAAEKIEGAIAATYSDAYWYTGTPGTVPNTFLSIANVSAIADDANIPAMDRKIFHSPQAAITLADALKGVFPNDIADPALKKAFVSNWAGLDHYKTVFAPTHVSGVATGTPTVNGASQNVTYATAKDTWSQTIVTQAWTNSVTGILKKGDIITFAGVFAVNPSTKASTTRLQTFVVGADVNSSGAGAATVTISPPIITSGAFQTVSAAPANAAAITVVTGAGRSDRQSLMFDPAAITLVTRPLDIPGDQGLKTSTQQGNAVTVSVSEWVDGNTLNKFMRFDMLYKALMIDPRKAVRLTN